MIKISYDVHKFPTRTLTTTDIKKIAAHLASDLESFSFTATAGIAFVTRPAMQDLNHTFRGKKNPTNVLSFPQYSAVELKRKSNVPLYLGDIALCLPVIRKEAAEKKIPLKHHLIHLVVHGTLHLLGFDHETDSDAKRMESKEIAILARLSVANPYEPTPMPSTKRQAHKKTKARQLR